uniref:Putative secreted protein n=1 Tax=Rhipicephalus microplus TaxID=6941 RepID=A0A6G5A1W4_RHIMP
MKEVVMHSILSIISGMILLCTPLICECQDLYSLISVTMLSEPLMYKAYREELLAEQLSSSSSTSYLYCAIYHKLHTV